MSHFKLEAREDADKIESIFFHGAFITREVLPHELEAFFDFKDQVEMMNESGYECSFNEVVESAKELKAAFNKAIKILKKPKSKNASEL